MTVSIRNPRPIISARVVMPWNAVPTVRKARPPRPEPPRRYRYELTPIDVIFDAATQTAEAEQTQARTDRRTGIVVLGIGVLVLITACVAAGLVIDQLARATSSFFA